MDRRSGGDAMARNIGATFVLALACAAAGAPAAAQPPIKFTGFTAYYSEDYSGQTASGERYDPKKFTAAHRTLPFGTMVRVTNQRNGRSVIVRINDRGPYSHSRIIDLSEAAAKILGMIEAGVVPVVLVVVGR